MRKMMTAVRFHRFALSRPQLLALGGCFLLPFSLAGAVATASPVQLRYLGTAGWEITHDTTTVLIDPYLSRLKRVTPNDVPLATDTRPLFTNDDVARSDTATIDTHIKRADFILITHTHYDHALDAPYIATKTGAMIVGTESTYHFARANGVAGDKLMIVRGGEDYEFGAFSLKVIPSLHGVLRRAPNARPNPDAPLRAAIFPSGAKAPFRVGELLIEGGTLAYLLRIGGKQILAFGSMNYIEREIQGLRPDVAIIGAMPERREVFDYIRRLLEALGNPRMVLPTHWDRFNVPYGTPQEPALQRLQTFIAEVNTASASTKVLVPAHFEAITFP
jgi:L-ascorbate metabolism protein UlaG (beta-lactamase superfamily)